MKNLNLVVLVLFAGCEIIDSIGVDFMLRPSSLS